MRHACFESCARIVPLDFWPVSLSMVGRAPSGVIRDVHALNNIIAYRGISYCRGSLEPQAVGMYCWYNELLP